MRNLKILGLSLLALVGVMAISASAARAEWLLLLDAKSVSSQTFNITVGPGELLVPELGLEIHCEGGTGTAQVQLEKENLDLGGTATGTFQGCDDLEFGEVCDVHGKHEGNLDAAGKITAGGSGKASMPDSKTLLLNAESNNFAEITYTGEECPFAELENETVSGSVTLEVLNWLTDAELHQVHLVDQDLVYGNNGPAILHDGSGGTLSGSIKTLKGEKSAAHLVHLGCVPLICNP